VLLIESIVVCVGSTEDHYGIVCVRLYLSFRACAASVADDP
jgi:hypothetical protein